MSQILKLRCLTLIFLLLNCNLFSQEDEKNYSIFKSIYIYNFIKNFSWENESELQEFAIGVVGNKEIFDNLDEKYSSKTTEQNLPLKIKFYPDIKELDDADKLQILYADGNLSEKKLILEKIKGKGILLISENIDFESSMVSFLEIQKKLEFTLNIPNVEREGITPSTQVINLSQNYKK
jgi:two-component system, chemotaxis family, sensor kinase Cph1